MLDYSTAMWGLQSVTIILLAAVIYVLVQLSDLTPIQKQG